MIPYSFWQDVEKNLKHVLYGDTDSLYLHIPEDYATLDDTITGTSIIADEINERIKYYFNSYMLPKLGVNSTYNNTYFKTELIAESILFLETKKNYAYNLIYKEGKIIDPAETNYTGIPIVKSNTAPLTKDFLEYLIKNIALNKQVITREHVNQQLSNIGKILNDRIIQCIHDYDFEYIAAPCKWNDKDFISEPTTILGMKFYNIITESETFRPGGFGIYFPINIKSSGILQPRLNKNNITIDDIKYITVPYGYNKDKLKEVMIEFDLHVDPQLFWNWDRIGNNKVAKKIIELIKLSVGLPI
jgi:hypothetical protein